MALRSWLAKLVGTAPGAKPTSSVAQLADRPVLHPMVAGVHQILVGNYFAPQHAALLQRCDAIVKGAGPRRDLRKRELVTAFTITVRYSLPHCPDEEVRRKLQDLAGFLDRYTHGSDVDGTEIVAHGSVAVELLEYAKQKGAEASAALRRAVDAGDLTPEIGDAFDNAGRHVSAVLSVAQAFAVLAYVSDVRAEWATPDADALDRLFWHAGENAARQVLSVDKQIGVSLLSDLVAACHGSPAAWHEETKMDGRTFVQDLQSADPSIREKAAEALIAKPCEGTVDALIVALDDSRDMVRRYSALALGAARATNAVARLVQQATTHEDLGSRCTAIAALGDIGDPIAVEPLLGLLSHRDADIRRLAAKALGVFGDRRAVTPLLACLRDQKYGVRGTAIEALGAIGDPSAVQPIAEYYWDTEGDRRSFARAAWEAALRDWKENQNLSGLISIIKLDNQPERIIRSIAESLEAIERKIGGGTRSKSASSTSHGKSGSSARSKSGRWWQFWK